MTETLIRTPGFRPPVRSRRRLLHGIALPQLVAVLTLVLSTAALLTALSWSVASAEKRLSVPVSSLSLSRTL